MTERTSAPTLRRVLALLEQAATDDGGGWFDATLTARYVREAHDTLRAALDAAPQPDDDKPWGERFEEVRRFLRLLGIGDWNESAGILAKIQAEFVMRGQRVAAAPQRDYANEHREEGIARVVRAARPMLDKCDGKGDQNLTYIERMELRTALRELTARAAAPQEGQPGARPDVTGDVGESAATDVQSPSGVRAPREPSPDGPTCDSCRFPMLSHRMTPLGTPVCPHSYIYNDADLVPWASRGATGEGR